MLITAGFMAVEAAGGLLAGSLALLADAGHMFTDTAALAFAWLAFRLARRPADAERSYGYHRFQVLAAFLNGVVLIAIVVWIVAEAVERLREPVEILGGLMLAVAVIGLLANVVAYVILHGGSRDNLNVRGALLHVMGDLLGSAAAIVAALVIIATDWKPIDPILSVLVALLILRSAWALVRQSTHVLLEGTPSEIDVSELKAALVENVPEIDDVHHVHVWTLATGKLVMTLHAHVTEGSDSQRALRSIHSICRERFGVTHVTVQIEHGRCADVA
ncbi:MAG: cation diffusion facilitator family transporter [Gammaproteobacteria bacterium]|nr:cation diffusion facilitator family transporter [Gammaproteobacteria bacterium]NIM74130.1 cation diffusion facilitator family transporter [Gammaproteobacteria bacterium]NIN39013.1 cation diffusion facilitator family transporter [Gammaproteobacteria bacterium]NIO25906.1 cation diffusion facilitator family transporter [Gammaproteobacteria bacterium]NIO66537.1 cation diffusion facilitator family transporter [Gammaproteobacteria bacterium]